MKKNLRYFMTLLLMMVASVGWAEDVTDVLDRALTGVTNGATTYSSWSNKTATSEAVYAGNSAGSNNSIQLRSKNSNSGVVTTTSGGKLKKIVVSWNSNTINGRTLNVYGSNTAYSGASDLYSSSTQGELLGTIVCGTSTELTVTGDYEYVGLRSKSDPMYLDEVKITWEVAASSVEKPTFDVAAGTYTESQTVTITCGTPNASIHYTTDGTDPDKTSNLYSSPISINTTTTLKAIAYDTNGNASYVATATYTILSLQTIADARAQNTGTVYTQGVVTSCVGKTAYIQDDAAAICVYGTENLNLTVGDIISVKGTLSTYEGLLEITSPTVNVLSTGNTVEPEVMTIADILGENAKQGWLVKIENATVTAINESNTTIAQGENTIVVRGISNDLALNNIITLQGNIGCYKAAQIVNPTEVEIVSAGAPNINADNNVVLAYNATSGEIEYTIDNYVEGVDLEASCTPDADWISNIQVASDKVTFTTTPNEGTEPRTATFTLSYNGAEDKVVTVTQGVYVADYAELPFSWEGGVKDDLLALNGVTANDLGSDYADSNAPYRVKFDTTGDFIQVKTNERPGVVTIGVKMLGGANSSSIIVQESVDGINFDDLQTLTISGKQNTVLTLNTTTVFDEDSRYVRLSFNKGSNVGVGPIYIAKYATINFTIAEACTDGESYFGTFYTDKAYVMPEGVTGQTVAVDAEGKLEVNDAYTAGSVVPAETPLLMKATAAGEKTALVTTGGEDPTFTNMLKGTLTADQMTEGGDKYYRLTMHNGTTLGFYYGAADGAAFTPGANKAYLAVPASATGGAKEGFSFSEATGINNVNAVENTNEKIFNLAGQQMKSAVKGVYIKNGRKYVK